MPGSTTNFSWPYPTNADVANVASDMQSLATAIDASVGNAWTVFVPTWTASTTNPVLNNGTLTGKYKKLGKTVIFKGELTMGNLTTFGTGTYDMSLPFASSTGEYIGAAWVFDSSTATNNGPAVTRNDGVNLIRFYAVGGQISNTVPFTWATGDRLSWTHIYETA